MTQQHDVHSRERERYNNMSEHILPNISMEHDISKCHLNTTLKYLQVYEGNTSSGKSGSQSNGDGFYLKKRDYKTIMAVARPIKEQALRPWPLATDTPNLTHGSINGHQQRH